MELALLDVMGKQSDAPVEALLSMPALTGTFRYTAVLGDASPAAFREMAERYRKMGFGDFKIKLSHDAGRDRQELAVFQSWPEGTVRVRADANASATWMGSRAIIQAFHAAAVAVHHCLDC
jgi:L-alanine-DL-glutamate epimerase-like enolase superfamily enzyme